MSGFARPVVKKVPNGKHIFPVKIQQEQDVIPNKNTSSNGIEITVFDPR